MTQENWVKSLGLDSDGSLFVEIENGLTLYDLCLSTPLPAAVRIRPQDLMRIENRPLYYRFLTTLNEIDGVMFHPSYDKCYQVKKGDVVVDAGARIGTFTAKIAASVGDEGKVIAIEPEPRNYACLLKNIEANRLRNVVPISKMLWSRSGKLKLYLSANSAAHSAYCDPFYGPTGDSLSVEAETLDQILDDLGIESVHFIKMDIEGSELEALAGMQKTLRCTLHLAIAAYHPVQGTLSYLEIMPRLEQLGFRTSYSDGIVCACK